MDSSGLSGAILTGGASRRMGRDKASIELGGLSLLERAIRTLTDVADEVVVVGDRPSYHGYGVPVYADAYPEAGTLGGIATALRHAMYERVLVVACDMPLLSSDLLRAMTVVDADEDVIVPWRPADHERQGGRGTFETLHAIYHRRCLPFIERRIESGDIRVISFFDDVRVRTLDEGWLRLYDPQLQSFQNANTPEDLERVWRVLGVDSTR